MKLAIRRFLLKIIAYLFSDRFADKLSRILSKKLVKQIRDEATDEFLESLLKAMDTSFCLQPAYRANIQDFTATYVFETTDGAVGTTARFEHGDMRVEEDPAKEYTLKVIFDTPVALRRFLFAENQDVLESILANEVEVDGNLNYLFKFGFLARDLEKRLGVLAA